MCTVQALCQLLLGFMLWAAGLAHAQTPPSLAALVADEPPASTLYLNNRKVVNFRATLSGSTPAERVGLAVSALAAALKPSGPGLATRSDLNDSVRFEVDGQTVFFLVPGDIEGPNPAAELPAVAHHVLLRLQAAAGEAREARDPRSIAFALAYALGASLVAYGLARLLLMLRQRLTRRVQRAIEADSGALSTYLSHVRTALRLGANVLTWALLLLLAEAWASFVLRQFAYTRPWGERSSAWLLDLLQRFALGALEALPGLLVAVIIFALARVVARANTLFLLRVERGDTQLSWLDADTAVPTRRLGTVLIWLFALAMAYPYLPGANSEAFKALSVMTGLMLSLGASSVVGQALSGLSLMYSRSLRVGEYVKVGEVEGTVVMLGMFTTKVHTGMGEEVSLPNTVVFSQPIRNFSRLVDDGRFVLHTAVTIGYATPWRQVHAMLLEAAARAPGVAAEPPPYVVQTALSDFYVEYRLCAQSNKAAPQRRVEAMNQLHAHVLDVFNEHGVQIMSPHYMADPAEPQLVKPGPWASQPGTPPPG